MPLATQEAEAAAILGNLMRPYLKIKFKKMG
jgi:hypothetical protein